VGYLNAKTGGCRLSIPSATRRGYPWPVVNRTRKATDQLSSPHQKLAFFLQSQRSSSWPTHSFPSHFWCFSAIWKRM